MEVIKVRVAQYNAAFLVVGIINGVRVARRHFVLPFFEAMLIPMYLIIGIWARQARLAARLLPVHCWARR
jgi:NADH:ubiquinone oxidoreductase subunit 4 (subunit M)